jgi:hypothetical protein
MKPPTQSRPISRTLWTSQAHQKAADGAAPGTGVTAAQMGCEGRTGSDYLRCLHDPYERMGMSPGIGMDMSPGIVARPISSPFSVSYRPAVVVRQRD